MVGIKGLPAVNNRDEEVMAVIRRSLVQRGRMPTIKELAFELRTTRSAVFRNLRRLVANGRLEPDAPVGTLRYRIPDARKAKVA